jgi:extracellular factor (EF) 3-hydroxypalmitic acid methyl ester biosynthesis protein
MIHHGREMSLVKNGNGNGSNGHGHQAQKKAVPAAPASGVKDSQVTFETTEGLKLRGALNRVTRHSVVFELYSPVAPPRFSEALNEFKIFLQEREVYSGRAVVRNLVDAGNKIVCEATLNESDWVEVDFELLLKNDAQISGEFKTFLNEWQKLYKVSPEFKIVIADMQTFLHDLRLWLERMELGIRAFAQPLRSRLEKEALDNLAKPIAQSIDVFIDQFESIVCRLEDEAHPAHYVHLRRQLHPLILVSPFAHRAFSKPLGYAGDYQMVDMMLLSPKEGSTLFAKIINIWLLGQTPAQAHRNRVDYLERKLIEETMRAKADGHVCRIFNLGCGPAGEVRRFFENQRVCENANLTLVDFNEETLQSLQQILNSISQKIPEQPQFRLLKKSVYQILKDGARSLSRSPEEKYDYIYCAGLFDYLSFLRDACPRRIASGYKRLGRAKQLPSVSLFHGIPAGLAFDLSRQGAVSRRGTGCRRRR